LDVTLTPSAGADLLFYVRTVCNDMNTSLGCFDNAGTGGVESGAIMINQGDHVFIIVDGSSGSEGPYQLDVNTHAIVCGDKIVDPGEQCDPPNGTTCDAMCQVDVAQVCA